MKETLKFPVQSPSRVRLIEIVFVKNALGKSGISLLEPSKSRVSRSDRKFLSFRRETFREIIGGIKSSLFTCSDGTFACIKIYLVCPTDFFKYMLSLSVI